MSFERELAIALRLSRDAGHLALEYRRNGVTAEDKPDDSPVTAADRASEKLIAEGLAESFPRDGLLGEEGAEKTGASGRRWIIDPIDGTRDYIRGNRFWANLIGLEAEGAIHVGVASFPALGETYYATQGGGAWRLLDGASPERIHCSDIADFRRAVVCYNGLNNVARKPRAGLVLPFLDRAWAVRSVGGALDAMLVCSGSAEIWVEPSAKPWDLAPLRIIARESGACFFDYAGRDTISGGNAVICVPGLASEVRSFLELD